MPIDENFDKDSLCEQTMEETDDSNVQDSPGNSIQTSISNEMYIIYFNKIIP